jgi:hypothetical protein
MSEKLWPKHDFEFVAILRFATFVNGVRTKIKERTGGRTGKKR